MPHEHPRRALAFAASLALISALALPILGPRASRAQIAGGSPTPTAPGAFGPPHGESGDVIPGEVVVRLRNGAGNQPPPVSQAASVLSLAGVEGSVDRALVNPGSYVVSVTPGREESAAAALAAEPGVASASPNLRRHIHTMPLPAAQGAPNDPLYPLQWAYPRINAPPAWNGAAGSPITVAVLDTGVDLTHPELAGRVLQGANFVTPGGSAQDDNGHGTHVAGIVAAAGGNGAGGVGMDWNARILPVKVADGAGSLSSEDWLNGLAYAAQNGARVVNMSFGGTTYSQAEQDAVTDAWNRGVIIVASAGNSGDNGNPVEYPAGYDHVLSVAAVGSDNLHAYYSAANRFVDITAPGGNARSGGDPNDRFIISTWAQNIASNFQPGYAKEIGTSQAAPFVSGLAALLLAQRPSLTNDAVVSRIETTATDLGPRGRDDQFGFGLINVAAALGLTAPPAVPSATPRPPPPTVPPPAPPTRAPVPSATRPPPAPPTQPPPTAAPTPPVIPEGCLFVDVCVQRDPFGPFVQDLVRRGAAGGYRDGSFRPNDPVTRGQLAKMATLAAGFDLTTLSGPHFTDAPPTDPFYAYIETAFAQGLMTGYGDGTFRPQSGVTRGQMAKAMVLTRGWPLFDPEAPSFADVPYGTPFYLYVETASGLQVINSFADRTFHPYQVVTRADAAKIIDVALATFRPGSGGSFGGP
jgi:subtilisin family serine protease